MSETLCWRCRRSCTDQCCWAESGDPVEGWYAVRGVVSYTVLDCPLFDDRPLPKDALELSDEGCELFFEAIIRRAREDYMIARRDVHRHSLTCKDRINIESFLKEVGVKMPIIKGLRREAVKNDYIKYPRDRKEIELLLRLADVKEDFIDSLRKEAAEHDAEEAKKKKKRKT